MSWFKERVISEITLGGLLILVVIRTIQFNISRMRVGQIIGYTHMLEKVHEYGCFLEKFLNF